MIDPLQIKALYEEGHSLRTVAQMLSCNHMNVRRQLIRLGVPRRSHLEGQALYLARHTSLTEEERKIAQLRTYKKYDRTRRHLGKGINKWGRKIMLSLQRRKK